MPWRPSYKSDTIIDQIGYSEPIYPVCVIGHATVLTATKAAVQGWRWNVCPNSSCCLISMCSTNCCMKSSIVALGPL
jgi:hypothetical protein